MYSDRCRLVKIASSLRDKRSQKWRTKEYDLDVLRQVPLCEDFRQLSWLQEPEFASIGVWSRCTQINAAS